MQEITKTNNKKKNILHIIFPTVLKALKKLKKIFFSNKKSIIGVSVILLFVIIGTLGRVVFPYDETVNYQQRLIAPSFNHPLGTDSLGRDLFSQVIDGTANVLEIAFLTALITIIIGVTLGLISGLFGGIVDKTIQLITNVFITLPSFPVFIILAAIFTITNPFSFAVVLSIFNWAGLCRAIRAQIISLRERDFIQICNVMNMSKAHIIFKELMPNIASYILINFIIVMKNAITGSVGIMLLGLAAFEPSNWGAILLTAKDYGAMIVPEARLWLITPIICIAIFQFGVIMLSNGLDETLNPRLRKG